MSSERFHPANNGNRCRDAQPNIKLDIAQKIPVKQSKKGLEETREREDYKKTFPVGRAS